MDNGELNVKAPVDVIFESICACVYLVAVVGAELDPQMILPVLSIVHTTVAAGFFIIKGLVVSGVAITNGADLNSFARIDIYFARPLELTDKLIY